MNAATAEKVTPSPHMFDVCKKACLSEYENWGKCRNHPIFTTIFLFFSNSYFPNMFFFFLLFYRFVRKPSLLAPMSMLIQMSSLSHSKMAFQLEVQTGPHHPSPCENVEQYVDVQGLLSNRAQPSDPKGHPLEKASLSCLEQGNFIWASIVAPFSFPWSLPPP